MAVEALLRRAIILATGLALTVPAGPALAQDFAPAREFAAGPGARSVAVGDFDEDGRPDLAVANAVNPGNLVILKGDGTGGFGAPAGIAIPGSNSPGSVAVGDFNGDGHVDLAVADVSGTTLSSVWTYASVLIGDGAGGFTVSSFLVYEGLAYPSAVAVTDVNGDGRHDLVFAGLLTRMSEPRAAGMLASLLGDGAGGFPDRSLDWGGAVDKGLAVGDLNGDGHPDVATAASGRDDLPGKVYVSLGDGANNFNRIEAGDAGTGSSSVTLGDFDGDGRRDLAVANYGSDDLSVFLGDGAGKLGAPAAFAAHDGPRSVVAADLDGNGSQDLAVANALSGDVSVLPGAGNGTFGAPLHFPVAAANPYFGDGGRLAAADLDCNGTPDLAVANDAGETVSVLMNKRAGTRPPGCVGAPVNGDPAGDAKVDATVSAKRIQRQKPRRIRVTVRIAAREAVAGKATGTVRLGKRSYTLKAQTARVAAGATRRLALKPRSAAHERRIAKALRSGKRAKATVKVRLTDASATSAVTRLVVTLKR